MAVKLYQFNDEELTIILQGFGLHPFKLRCKYCDDSVDYRECHILPGIDPTDFATIFCNNLMCVAKFIQQMKDNDVMDRVTKNIKRE